MPKFVFEAKTPAGKAVKGSLDASSEQEARVRLRAQGFEPTSLRKQGVSIDFNPAAFLNERVPPKEMQIFTRQLSTLINSGVHLVQGLELLASGTQNAYFKKILASIVEDVGKGKSFAAAISRFPKVFGRLYYNMVRAGEEGGVLDVVLARLAEYIEKSVKLKGKVTGALWYPAGIIVIAAIVIMAILLYVIPQFEDLFSNSGQELPALTQLVINMSRAFAENWYIYILGGIGSIVFLARWLKTPLGKAQFDQIILRVPLFGDLVIMSAVARFSRTLSTLISSGVAIVEALEICGTLVGNSVIEKSHS